MAFPLVRFDCITHLQQFGKRSFAIRKGSFFANSFDLNNGEMLFNDERFTPSPYFYHDYGAVKIKIASGRHFALYRLAEM